MKIDREQWSRLSALLDAALDVDAGERESWLQQLSGDAATLREPLRALLAQRAHIETDYFLKRPDFVSALRFESARSQHAPPDLQAASEVGAYRLLRELGRGGMGSVWLAERIDGKLKRQVALKFPYAGPNQRQLAERLARERDILAGLEHPNIARLYDADVSSLGQPFLVLEYVDGIPINEYCDQHRLTVRERLVLALQVLNAVQYAHTHLVVHRDLKPSNILITNDGVARLLDFGIAKLVSDRRGARDGAHAVRRPGTHAGLCQPRTDQRGTDHHRIRRLLAGRRAVRAADRQQTLSTEARQPCVPRRRNRGSRRHCAKPRNAKLGYRRTPIGFHAAAHSCSAR